MSDLSNPLINKIIEEIKKMDYSCLISQDSSSDELFLSEKNENTAFALMDLKSDLIFASKLWLTIFEINIKELNEQSLLSIIDKSDYNKTRNFYCL